MEFFLEHQEYIELNKLLKLMGLVESGAEARQVILAGEVRVNGDTEYRVRNKIRQGYHVEFNGQSIQVQ